MLVHTPGSASQRPPSGHGAASAGSADLTSVSREAAGRLSHSGSWSWVWGWIPEGWLWDRAWEDTGRGLRRQPLDSLYTPAAARILLFPVSHSMG